MKLPYKRTTSLLWSIIFISFITIQSLKASQQEDVNSDLCFKTSVMDLPNEIKVHIFSFLDVLQLLRLRCVNKEFSTNLLKNYIKQNLKVNLLPKHNSKEQTLLTTLANNNIPLFLEKSYKIYCEIVQDIYCHDTALKWIQLRTQIILRNYIKNADYIRALTKYFKVWYKKLWPQMDGIHSPESLITIQQFHDKCIESELTRLEAINSTLSSLETLKYAKLFLAANRLESIISLIEPWATINFEDLPIETQYFLYKNRYHSLLNQKLFVAKRHGTNLFLQSTSKQYLPLKALTQQNNKFEAITVKQARLKNNARVFLRQILSSINNILDKDSLALVDSLVVRVHNKDNFEKSYIYTDSQNHIFNHYGSITAKTHSSISISNYTAVIVDEDIYLKNSSEIFIDVGFLKVNGGIKLEPQTRLYINAAFIKIDNDIEGEGEIILNGENLKSNGIYSRKLKEDFELENW